MEGRPTLSDNLSGSSPDSWSDRTSRSLLPLLAVRMEHRAGMVALDLAFELKEPWTVLFGPSGSGKTTVLRAIAGFVQPEKGSITQGDRVLVDSALDIFVPAHQRPVRSAAQTPRLFPQMTVRRNAVYGCGWKSRPAEAMEIVEQVLELFGLKDVMDRMPHELSGGERQRASVARAVISAITFVGPGTALLLLDEPFSGLDHALRDELLAGLRQWLRQWKIPVLSVTHDVGEAFQLGAEVIRISDGKVLQQGWVSDVLADERLRLIEQLQAEPS